MRSPTILEKTLHVEELKDHRALDCSFYKTCLHEAAIFFWTSFSCASCEHKTPQRKEPPKCTDQNFSS